MTILRKITREIFDDYLHCKTKGFLTIAGEPRIEIDYGAWRLRTAAKQRANSEANFIEHYQKCTIQRDVALTSTEVTGAPDAIVRAHFDNELYSLHFDAIIKDKYAITLQQKPTYSPVLFADSQVRAPQKILLALLAVVLSELQGQEQALGLIFAQRGRPSTVHLGDDLKLARGILSEIKNLQQGADAPMLVLNDHCQVCEFRARCRAQATKQDNLSLLRGMDERRIKQLNEKGIFTITQLSYSFKARRRPKRTKKPAPVNLLPLRALALREKKVFVHGDPSLTLANTRVFIDIEGTRQDNTYYLIGIHAISCEGECRASYWADGTSEQEQVKIFIGLLDQLSQYNDYTLLHFGAYETTALRRMRSRVSEIYSVQIDNALKRSVNVLSLISAHVYFPTYSNTLKDIGSFLGHEWSDQSASGIQTLVWRSLWLENYDIASKAKLIRYNGEDCAALRIVVEFLEHVIAADPIAPSSDHQGTEVMRTSRLSAKRDGWSIFGETKYVLDEFRAINKLSYFDYQREKVFTRAGGHRRKKTAVRPKGRPRPNKIIAYRASKCPSCHGRVISPLSRNHHDIEDLRFTRGGIKRWITRHEIWRYSCKRCGIRFYPAAVREKQPQPKYGRGLISWCMYQLLVGGQSIYRIHGSLKELFGLSIPKTLVYLFKRATAAYFEAGYRRILTDLLNGKLIHIDETTINLQKE